MNKKAKVLNAIEAARNRLKKVERAIVAAAAIATDSIVANVTWKSVCNSLDSETAASMIEEMNKAVKVHAEIDSADKNAEAELFAAITKVAEKIVCEEATTKRGGYVINDIQYEVYYVNNDGTYSIVKMYGDSWANRHNNTGKIVVAMIRFIGECPKEIIIDGEIFVVVCSSNGGLKGHQVSETTKEGTAIAYRKSFYETQEGLKREIAFSRVLTEEAVKDGIATIETALDMQRAVKELYTTACEEASEAESAYMANLHNRIAQDMYIAADAARKSAYDEYCRVCGKKGNIGYIAYEANPDAPKHTAAKCRASYETTPCDAIEYYNRKTDIIVSQDDTMDDVSDVVVKMPNGTEKPSKYHFTGDDGGAYVPVGRFPIELIKKYHTSLFQYRIALSGKGAVDVGEHIRLSEAKKRFGEDVECGLRLSEDNSMWIYIWKDEEIFIEDAEGRTREFIPGETAILSESCWKSKALDKTIDNYLSREEQMALMACEWVSGFIRLGRQAFQILSQMTSDEASRIASKTTAENLLLMHPYWAHKKAISQIKPFNHPALRWAGYAPASQRQLNKTVWAAVDHAGEGRFKVAGGEFIAKADCTYAYDRANGKSREDSGIIDVGYIMVPKSSGLKIGQKVWVIRYPLTNPRPVIMIVQGYCPEGRVEFSMKVGETIMQDLAMDFDGDHVYLVWDTDCVNAAIRTRDWIDSFMEFKHFTADDIPALEAIKHIPAHEYATKALGLGDIGKETSPIFILQAMLHEGMQPNESIILPNGEATTPKEVITLIYWICAVVTWEADAVKRGASAHFEKTAIGKKIARLTKGLYAESQPFARPYETDMFGMLRGKDKIANKKQVINPFGPISMMYASMIEQLKWVMMPDGCAPTTNYYANYSSVMAGAYDENGNMTGGFVYRLVQTWADIFKRAETAKVNLAHRWGINTAISGTEWAKDKLFIDEPIGTEMYHIGKDTEVTGIEFRKILNMNCSKPINFEPGWATYIDEDGNLRPTKERGLSLALFVARKERSVTAQMATYDNDGGRKKTVAKETAYDSARKLIRAWAWRRLHKDLTDREVDEILYMELGYALIGEATESTNMGASLQEWANYFSDTKWIKDSVSGERYQRNFLTRAADRWLIRHNEGICDDGKLDWNRARIEMEVTDVQYLHWLKHFDVNDLLWYKNNDIDHVFKADDSEELDTIEDVENS